VGSFGLGIGAMYVALAYCFTLLFVFSRLAKVIVWSKRVVGFLAVILGLTLASGTYSSLSAFITKSY